MSKEIVYIKDLKCPICDRKQLVLEETFSLHDKPKEYFVACHGQNCGLFGPTRKTKEGAIKVLKILDNIKEEWSKQNNKYRK